MSTTENEENLRLKKAKESLDYYREKENQARRELASAAESTAQARRKFEELFEACEKRAVARRKSGQIAA